MLSFIAKLLLGHSANKNYQIFFACGEKFPNEIFSGLHETFPFVQACSYHEKTKYPAAVICYFDLERRPPLKHFFKDKVIEAEFYPEDTGNF